MSAAPGRRALAAWRAAVFGIFGLAGLGMSSWFARIPTVRDDLHASTGEMGLLSLAIAIGSIAGLTVAGTLIERFGTRAMIAIGLAATVLALPVAALGATIAAFGVVFAGLVVFGLGTGLCDVAMNVSGAANERGTGRSVMPLFHAVFSFGTVTGVAIGSLVDAADVPVLLHIGVICAVMAVLAAVALPRLQPEHVVDEAGTSGPDAGAARGTWRHRLAPWRRPRTLLLGVIVLGMALSEGSANDWLPLAMVDGHGASNAGGAAVLAVFLAAMTLGRIVGNPLLDRFGRVPVLRVCALLAVVGLGVFVVVPVDGLAITAAALWGLGTSLGFPVGITAAADDPRHAAANVSTASMIGYVAFLGGPPAIGFLAEHAGILHALVLVLIVVAAAGLVSGAARRP